MTDQDTIPKVVLTANEAMGRQMASEAARGLLQRAGAISPQELMGVPADTPIDSTAQAYWDAYRSEFEQIVQSLDLVIEANTRRAAACLAARDAEMETQHG